MSRDQVMYKYIRTSYLNLLHIEALLLQLPRDSLTHCNTPLLRLPAAPGRSAGSKLWIRKSTRVKPGALSSRLMNIDVLPLSVARSILSKSSV